MKMKTYKLVVARTYYKTAEIEVQATSEKKARLLLDTQPYADKLSAALYDDNFNGGEDTIESIEEVKP